MKLPYRQPRPRRLRKQPKMRRVHTAAAISEPRLTVPKTARKRKQRNSRRFRLPMAVIRRFLLSSRWVSLGLTALTIYALILVGMDEHFYLSVIPVEGAVSVPAADIVEASALGGIHVFAADPNLAAERIAALPGVVAASVTLQWPNQVDIHVQEESPLAIWREGGNQFWITEGGHLVLARTGAIGLLAIESEMPIMAGEESTDEVQASMAFIPEDVLAGALMLRELRPNIDQLSYRPSGGLSYEDGRGWRVYFGTGTNMNQKLVVYETIVDELLARGVTPAYVSVSNQEKPYYRVQ